MIEKAIPICFEELDDKQLQLLFEERTLEGFESQAMRYCEWLLKFDEEKREKHYRSLSRMAHAVRCAYGAMDITPECECEMCRQWYWTALKEIRRRSEKMRAWLGQRKEKELRRPRPTYIYLVLDEETGYIKIGRAKEPSARERTLQSQKPMVTMLFSFPADARKEKELHHKYAEFRVRGEWFKLSMMQVEEIRQHLSELGEKSADYTLSVSTLF